MQTNNIKNILNRQFIEDKKNSLGKVKHNFENINDVNKNKENLKFVEHVNNEIVCIRDDPVMGTGA